MARQSYGKLVALLAVRTRDVAAAEDALSEAFAAALVDWPEGGVPRTPEAWLLSVARRKWIDATPAAPQRRAGRAATCVCWPRRSRPRPPAAPAAGRAARADVRLRASRDRRRRPRAADPADPARIRRGRDRLGLPGLARQHEPAPGARQTQDPGGRDPAPGARASRISRRGSRRCWRRSTPPSRRAGPTRPAPRRAAAISPRKASGSAGSSSRCSRTSPRRSGSSP